MLPLLAQRCYNGLLEQWSDTSVMIDGEIEDTTLPRSRVFVLIDGTFVVRWSESRVQELESGLYRSYEKRDFGASITDYELRQLQDAGLVEFFDADTVSLTPLPERRSDHQISAWEANRTRSYYLNTTLPADELSSVKRRLEELGLQTQFEARVRQGFVVLWEWQGRSFRKFDDVEKARTLLASTAPQLFGSTVIAFVETTKKH